MRPSEALAKHRDEVREIIARYPVSNPRIFGSAARGEDVEGSDLDILVERIGPMSFFDIFDLEEKLKTVLGCPVEVSTGLKPHARETAARDLRPI
jgi:predicted nucleotidyltransferase